METRLFAVVIDSTAPETIYAAGDGVLKSRDGGRSWRSFDAGLPPALVPALATDPTTPGRLYAGTLGGGVFSIQQVSECTGDCDGDGSVAVAELITGVRIALDNRPSDVCPSFDPGEDGRVSIEDLTTALNDALYGCSAEGRD